MLQLEVFLSIALLVSVERWEIALLLSRDPFPAHVLSSLRVSSTRGTGEKHSQAKKR